MTEELARMEHEEFVVPRLGEIINLADAPTVARALREVRHIRAELQQAANVLSAALVEEATRQGSKTLHLEGGLKAVVKERNEPVWDVELLETLVTEHGLPQQRFDDMVTQVVTYKVSAGEAKRIGGANPAYAEVIGRARSEGASSTYVEIQGQGSLLPGVGA